MTPLPRAKHRIMVVDDEPGLQRMILRAASLAGLGVIQAMGGAQALTLAAEERPDLILLDIMMPGLDGRSVLRALKSDDRTRGIPVFVYSALGAQSDRIKGLKLGADDYFDKPFDLDLLIGRIKQRIQADVERARSAVKPE